VHVRELVGGNTEKRRSDPQRETNADDDELRGQWSPERSPLRTGYDHFAVGSPDHIHPPVRENAKVAVGRAPTLASPETLDDAPERSRWSTFAIGEAICARRHPLLHPNPDWLPGEMSYSFKTQAAPMSRMPGMRLGPRSTAASARGGVPYPRRWLVAVVMVGAVLINVIDITIVNFALPTIGRDLEASGTQLEWIVSVPPQAAFAAVQVDAAIYAFSITTEQ